MGRADIAILSNISVGIRLCLHPPALLMGGSAYDDWSLVSCLCVGRPIFVAARRNVPRRTTASSHLITHISARSVVTGSYGLVVLPVDENFAAKRPPARPMAGQQDIEAAPVLASIRPKFTLRSGYPLPGDVQTILVVSIHQIRS